MAYSDALERAVKHRGLNGNRLSIVSMNITELLEQQISLLENWKHARILVAGDFILDHYIYGHAERLSPDAPVPVLARSHEEYKPGGASNVCLDLRALGIDVDCLGVIGDDDAGRILKRKLEEAGCNTEGLVIAPGRPTTLKQNYVGLSQHRHPQKMFRVDNEEKSAISKAMEVSLLRAAKKAITQGLDAVCIEDYDKGVITQDLSQGLIRISRQKKVPVHVDPALISDYSKYRGATSITPNRFEAARATGVNPSKTSMDVLHKIAGSLLKKLDLECAVLTLDRQGVLFLERGKKPVHLETVARQVYDVTGAGDMLLAALAAARANNASWLSSLALANTAAGLEVEKFGVVPIELDEMLLYLIRQRRQTSGKIREMDELLKELNALRRSGAKVSFTNGCFDILHAGHVAYLRQARKEGDLLVVGINSDESVRRLKGPTRPVTKLEDRLMVLSELESVDYLVVFGETTSLKTIQKVKPDVLVKGADYKKSEVIGADFVEKRGGKVVLIPLVEGRSTTNIIREIHKRGPRKED